MLFTQYQNLYYTTCTIHNWIHLLESSEAKEIIYSSWEYLARKKICKIYAFVIMSNHLHWIYEAIPPHDDAKVKHSFLSFTSKQLLKLNQIDLMQHKVNKLNRKYQIWKSPSLSVEIVSNKFLTEKMNYIHNNPLAANLCNKPEDYLHSSFRFYLDEKLKPEYLTLW